MSTKDLLILILLTIVMGYILGLMISTTVNYKLNDLIVNLPRPIVRMRNPFLKDKQNITVNIPNQTVDSETNEGFTSKIKRKTKKSPPIKVIEKFQPSVENIPNKALIEDSIYYNHKLEDKNMNSYARLFNINDKNIKDDDQKFTYSAFNKEDSDEQYIFLDNDNNKAKTTEVKSNNSKGLSLLDNLKKSVSKIKEIIPRKKRKPDYKCKCKWDNCTSSHKVV
jgi:hypothetical protein